MSHAADFPLKHEALKAAAKSGALWTNKDGTLVYSMSNSGFGWERRHVYYHEGKWHISSGDEYASVDALPADVVPIIRAAREAAEGAGAREDAPVVYEEKAAAPNVRRPHHDPTFEVEFTQYARKVLAQLLKTGVPKREAANLFSHYVGLIEGNFEDDESPQHAAGDLVMADEVGQSPGPGSPGAEVIVERVLIEAKLPTPETVYTDRFFGVPYVGEEAAAPRGRRKSGPLRWKRAGQGHYKADGIRGLYEVKRIKPNRRAGLLPWSAEYKGSSVRTFESADEAKSFAQAMDSILSDPLLCPTQQGKPFVAPRMPLPLPPVTSLRPALKGPPPRMGKPQGWKGYADEADKKGVDVREAITFEHISRDVTEIDDGKRYGKIETAFDVYNLLHDDLKKTSQEVFIVLPLSLKNELLCKPVEIARGQRDRVSVDETDVLRPVIVKNATSYWLAHSHPSGDASRPSKADIDLTNAIIKASKIACPGVSCVSHVIVGHNNFYDFASKKNYKVK